MKVVHCNEPHTHYIGRPSTFGNPYKLRTECAVSGPDPDGYSRSSAIELFEAHARRTPSLMAAIRELPEDAVLGCWCKPKACHGDIIVKLWHEMHDPKLF